MNKKTHLGKVVATKNGYKIRHCVESKKTKRSFSLNRRVEEVYAWLPTGKFGVYAGKNKKAEFNTVDEALAYTDELYEKSTK